MKYIVMIICFAIAGLQIKAQDSTTAIKNLLDNKQFAFQPTNMTPTTGRTRVLDYGYSLRISGDSLISNLPYFGTAYVAPINSNDAGMNFTSTNFSYTISTGKKGKYIVTIITKDRTYNTTFVLTVYNNKTAYLQANSTDKQQISYNGSLK